MVPQYHPSSPTPRPQGVVEALASSPPVARRRRLNSCSSGAGRITGIAGWRRAPRARAGSASSLGMGMQSTPARRSKSIDTIPWDSKATRRTEKEVQEAMLEELIRDFGEDGSDALPSGGERQSQHSGDPHTPFTQWQDPLETTSESTREVYVDLEAPLNYGTSSAPVTPRSSGGKHRVSDDEQTPRGPRSTSTALSFDAHYDVSAPLIDEDQRTPTEVQRRASSKIASRQLTPRPKLDLRPSDPPWSSTPSVFDEEPVPKPRYRDTSSLTPPEIPRRRYSSLPPWEVPLRTTPPSPLHFGALLSDDFDFPSSVPLPEYAYNPEREERALQPDPFGFSRIAAIVAGRTPQVYLSSSQGEEMPERVYTPPRFSSPQTSPEEGPVSPEAALSARQSSPVRDDISPRKKKHYWLGERLYKRMERASKSDSESEPEEALVKRSRKSKSSKKKSVPARRATPEPDQAALAARAARIAHFKDLDEHYNLTVEYVWS